MYVEGEMITLLISGPIGSGKSEACSYFAGRGVPVYDCDSRTKMLYSLIPGLKCDIEEALGVSWDRIGIIFSDDVKREKLESIVYPYVAEDIKAWKAAQNAPLLVIESAVMLQKSIFNGLYDKVLIVGADFEVRCRRNPKAAERDSLQNFADAVPDWSVENNGELKALHNELDIILKDILN